MTSSNKNRTLNEILNDPENLQEMDTWLRNLSRARNNQPRWEDDTEINDDKG